MPSLGTLPIEKRFSDDIDIDFGEDVSSATIKFRAYAGSDGALLFSEKTMAPVPGSPNVQRLSFTAADTEIPGTYYAEMDVLWPGGENDPGHLTLRIEGRRFPGIVLPAPQLPTTIAVSPGGGADFTSPDAAIASISDASSARQYLIECHPGDYTMAPWSMKPYVHVKSVGPGVRFIAGSNTQSFIGGAANSRLVGVAVRGPTSANCAALEHVGTGYSPFIVERVEIEAGYFGVWCHPSSYGIVHLIQVVNHYTGSPIDRFVHCTEYGNVSAVNSFYMNGPAGSCAYGFCAMGPNAEMTLKGSGFSCPDGTGLYADDGATVRAKTTDFHRGTRAVHVGGNGTGTVVKMSACTIDSELFTDDIFIDPGDAAVWFSGGVADPAQITVGAGASFTRSFMDTKGNRYYADKLGVGNASVLQDNPLAVGGDATGYLQANLQNHNSGPSASGDWIATADTGDDETGYVDMGINSSTYSDPAYTITGPLDGYHYAAGGHLAIGTASAGKNLIFHTGGTQTQHARVEVTDTALELQDGVALKMRSPDGTWYAVTVVDGGTVSVTPA